MGFGKQLREERKRSGMTIGDLARHLEVSITYLSDVEREQRTPLNTDRILAATKIMRTPAPRIVELLRSAAESRGAFELSTDVSAVGQQVGAALMRGWPSMSEGDFLKLRDALGGVLKMTKDDEEE